MSGATNEPVKLPAREARGHKGTFGTVAVVGGCAARPNEEGRGGVVMVGGPALAAVAALRAGAGLVRLAMPEPILAAGLSVAPSATGLALAVDHEGMLVGHLASAAIDELAASAKCLAIGPGLGDGEGARATAVRAVWQDSCPVVVDADALNRLCEVPEVQRDWRAAAVITPHVGEFRRLAEALGVSAREARTDEESVAGAEQLAQRLGCVVVLKSARTVVSDGQRTWAHEGANSALATAGTGDVLCGAIAGLIAQHYAGHIAMGEKSVTSERMGGLSLFDCARAGVAAHALAGAEWVKERGAGAGLLAMELAERLPRAVESLRGR